MEVITIFSFAQIRGWGKSTSIKKNSIHWKNLPLWCPVWTWSKSTHVNHISCQAKLAGFKLNVNQSCFDTSSEVQDSPTRQSSERETRRLWPTRVKHFAQVGPPAARSSGWGAHAECESDKARAHPQISLAARHDARPHYLYGYFGQFIHQPFRRAPHRYFFPCSKNAT